jgi:hypothetical protein
VDYCLPSWLTCRLLLPFFFYFALYSFCVQGVDAGAEICFRFASPTNRVFTGPLSRFTRMLHSPLYDIMLGWTSLKVSPANAQGTRWRVAVAKGNTLRTFLWTLSKQTAAPYVDCWMTDNVLLVQ